MHPGNRIGPNSGDCPADGAFLHTDRLLVRLGYPWFRPGRAPAFSASGTRGPNERKHHSNFQIDADDLSALHTRVAIAVPHQARG